MKTLTKKIKENVIIRSVLFKLLNGYEAKRKIRGFDSFLTFNAGTNFNFFFTRELEIENEAVINLVEMIKKDFIIFDLGANIGYYTIIFSSFCTEGKIIAFEPDDANRKYLLKNVESNKINNVTILSKAISNKIGESVFFEDKSTGRTSSLQSNAWHPNAAKINEQIVSTTTLDEISKEFGVPNFIKCDVEGHEVEVLEGATKVLANKPILFLEVMKNNRDQVMAILKGYNYNFYNGEVSIKSQPQPLKEIDCPNILCV